MYGPKMKRCMPIHLTAIPTCSMFLMAVFNCKRTNRSKWRRIISFIKWFERRNRYSWASYASTGDAEHDVSPGILRALDANNITKELWNNNQAINDAVGKYAKFASPTIVNGHVYLPTFSNRVVEYGLK